MEKPIQIPVAIGLIRDKQGRILLQKRVDKLIPLADGKWEFPGGRIDYGESPAQTVERECTEEVGCKVRVTKIIPYVQSTVWPRSDGKEQHVIVLCYEAELISGKPQARDKKVSDVRWFLKDEINTLDTLKGIKEFISFSGKL